MSGAVVVALMGLVSLGGFIVAILLARHSAPKPSRTTVASITHSSLCAINASGHRGPCTCGVAGAPSEDTE